MSQGDLFNKLRSHAGRGLSQVPVCSKCGGPLEFGNRNKCMKCAWDEIMPRWTADPSHRLVLGDYVPPLKPFDHQYSCLTKMRDQEGFALLMEMGTGKTKVIIDDWASRVMAGDMRDLVVVAPKGVYRNWEGARPSGVLGELGIHLHPALLERTLIATWGPGARRREYLKWMLANTDVTRPRVLLVNVEAFSTGEKAEDAVRALLEQGRGTFVVDESTTIRNPRASRTQTIIGLSPLARLRRIASGLPTPKSPMDLFSQFEFLDWRILKHKSWYGFRARYAVTRKIKSKRQDGTEGKARDVIVAYRNIEELRDRIEDTSFRVLKDECLDLPPKLYQPLDVDLTKEQQRVYDSLKQSAMAQLSSGDYVSATEVLPRLIRMQQVLCGFVVDEEGREHMIESNRIDVLIEQLDLLERKAIIWAPFRRSLQDIHERIQKEFGRSSVVRFWGGVPANERLEAGERIQNDPGTRFMVANPSTGGWGNTWTEAKFMFYFSNTPNLEHRLQSEDRAHRPGQNEKLTIVDLIAQGTIDNKWVQTLRNKLDLASVVTGDSYREWLV